MVLVRQRPHLVKTFTFEFRQPYHTAEKVPRAEAQGIVSHIQTEARGLAYKAIHTVQKNLLAQGYAVKYCCLLLAAGRPLPSLAQILESHALIHTADGELFRDAVLHASKRCGLETITVKECDLLDKSSGLLRLEPATISRRVADLGVGLGPPWTQDEKLAALIAWFSLTQPLAETNRAQKKAATPGAPRLR